MVGGADFIKTGDEEGEGAVNKAVIGDIIIVCAQVIMMLLMPMMMRMMRRWRTDSCLVVDIMIICTQLMLLVDCWYWYVCMFVGKPYQTYGKKITT